MNDAELLKYDVRVRERLLRSGAINPALVQEYLESLSDLTDRSDPIPLDQPALLRSESERRLGVPAPRTIERSPDLVATSAVSSEPADSNLACDANASPKTVSTGSSVDSGRLSHLSQMGQPAPTDQVSEAAHPAQTAQPAPTNQAAEAAQPAQ
ncbi:hypothetical protein ACFL5O_10210, partial [Myxococcota bacterium]